MTRLVVALSGNRRRLARVGISTTGISAAAFSKRIDELTLYDSSRNDAINLAVCPDHHLLQPRGSVLEVIETTGGSAFASRFFLDFADESGLTCPRDPASDFQSAGTARLEDGKVVGGVRHQFKEAGDRLLIGLAVEFPSATPGWMIRQHQWHLACEWSNWIDSVRASLLQPLPSSRSQR